MVRAVQTTATFVVVVMVGAWLANNPKPPHQLLDPTTLSKLGRLVMGVVSPLMIMATVGETVSRSTLAHEGWVLVVWSFIFQAECCLIALAVSHVARVPSWFRVEFVLSVTFPNALAAPLVMMATLCRQEPFVGKNFGSDSATPVTCAKQSLTYLAMYTTGWMLSFFALGMPNAVHPDRAAAAKRGETFMGAVRRRLRGLTNINVVFLGIGFVIAMLPTLQHQLYSPTGGLLWVSSACYTLGGPLVGMSSLVVGGTLGQSIRRVYLNRRERYLDRRESRRESQRQHHGMTRESVAMVDHRPWAEREHSPQQQYVLSHVSVFGAIADSSPEPQALNDGEQHEDSSAGLTISAATAAAAVEESEHEEPEQNNRLMHAGEMHDPCASLSLRPVNGDERAKDARSVSSRSERSGRAETPPPSGGEVADGHGVDSSMAVDVAAAKVNRPTVRTLLLLVLTRMVLCPLVCGTTLM